MCGIAGVLSLGRPIRNGERAAARRMNDLLRHRGPDDRGDAGGPRFHVGNTRLEILDLSHDARLPMSNEDGSVVLCYNGEVTNFRELADHFDLRRRYRFQSSGDSEVVLRLYQLLGIECLNHLSGMFALCLIDRRLGRAWLARDFFGTRPLFWMRSGDRLWFASELKSFFETPGFDPSRIDHDALYHFLGLAYIPDRMTPYLQVRELQGGWLLEVDLGRPDPVERCYYRVEYRPDRTIGEREAVVRLREEMFDSVRRNLISDAPLGLTLSGGFDTSSILAIARHLGRSRELHTFSIRIDEPSFDESRWQALMVDFARPVHHEVVVKPDTVRELFLSQMAYLDEPSGDGAAIPTWLLAADAGRHVKVLLSGEGGDEMFNAYETHLAWKVRRLYRRLLPGPLRSLVRQATAALPTDYRKLSFDFLAKRFSAGVELPVPHAHYFWRHSLSEEQQRQAMPGHVPPRPTWRLFADLYDSLDWPDELNRLSLVDLAFFFIGDLMVKNDRMMMAHSIEARFPWMDRILFEFVATIPPEMRLKGLARRYLQKQAMRPFVPEAIYRRPNMGLEMPHSIWFRGPLAPFAAEWLTRRRVERTGFLAWAPIERMWREHQGGLADHGRSLWCVMNLLAWFELFVLDGTFRDHLHAPQR